MRFTHPNRTRKLQLHVVALMFEVASGIKAHTTGLLGPAAPTLTLGVLAFAETAPNVGILAASAVLAAIGAVKLLDVVVVVDAVLTIAPRITLYRLDIAFG
jgi:hypothetical protein